MDGGLILLLVLGPAAIALAALWGAIYLYGILDKTEDRVMKVMIWLGIVLLGTVVFGIGSCYAMTFGGRIFRIH